jgi:KUP system potassium uptake protein
VAAHGHHHKVTLGALIVTLGIIYGDIGTSPLYVMKAIVGNGPVSADIILGGISCIFWTLTLQTTLKYVTLALRADNKGEGGIFALYTQVRRSKSKWLIYPAIIGGAALLADGVITPPISVSSAVEGLDKVSPFFKDTTHIVLIVVGILSVLFAIQQFGTKFIGRFFGPIMLVWFSTLAILGIYCMSNDFSVLKALNPAYAYSLLVQHPGGFWILGAVFLCTTGAEALYSDLGHCGKQNIRLTWIGVKIALVLNYMGQGAYLLAHQGQILKHGEVIKAISEKEWDELNPFYEMMPHWFVPFGIAIATGAAVVASQALISASFTLVNEAMRLNLWPKVKIKYPTELKGQLYIPSINWILWLGCMVVVMYFRQSSEMEAAYGLTINIDMLMTSTLLVFYMVLKRFNPGIIVGFILVYFSIELCFFVANIIKFLDGAFVSLIICCCGIYVMWVWMMAKRIRARYVEFVKIDEYKELIAELSTDLTIPKYSTHLVYLTSANYKDEIERKVIYSILQNRPKRADLYWFVHVDVVDEPYRMEYKVNHLQTEDIIRIDFKLGFRVAPRINLLFKKVVEDLMATGEVDVFSRYESLNKKMVMGDFRFIVIEKIMSNDNDFPVVEKLVLESYDVLKKMSLSEANAYGLDGSNVVIEKFPLVISPTKDIKLLRVE